VFLYDIICHAIEGSGSVYAAKMHQHFVSMSYHRNLSKSKFWNNV